MLSRRQVVESVFSRYARFARHVSDSPLTVAFLTFVLVLVIVFCRWKSGGRDWSYFVVAGQKHVDQAQTPIKIAVHSEGGYDGMFFTRLAFDPWSTENPAYGIWLGRSPGWRQQRILYPLIVSALSLGDPERVLVWLVLVNVIAIAAASGALSWLARDAGFSAAWGFYPGVSAGLIVAMSRDLAEPLNFACLAWAIVCCRTGRMGWCSCLLILAMLTREPSMLSIAFLGAVILWQLVVRREGNWSWLLTPLAPLAVFIVWHLYLRSVWGQFPSERGATDLGFPLSGLIHSLKANWPEKFKSIQTLALMMFLWLVWVGVEVVLMLSCIKRESLRENLCLKWCISAWLGWTVFASCFSPSIWIDYNGYMRIMLEWSLFGFCALMLSGRTPSRYLATYTVLVGLLTARSVVVLL